MAARDLILRNFWLKAFSLFLAALIWFVLQPNLQKEGLGPGLFRLSGKTAEFRRPVTVLVTPTDRRAFQVEPAEVTVRLRGRAGNLAQLNAEDVHAYVDLAALRDVHGRLRVEARLPRGVDLEIVEILPPAVEVKPAN